MSSLDGGLDHDRISRSTEGLVAYPRHGGVNLPRAVVEGWLQRDELEELIIRCAACGRGAACEAWLAGSGSAEAMPEFCPNKAGIEALG